MGEAAFLFWILFLAKFLAPKGVEGPKFRQAYGDRGESLAKILLKWGGGRQLEQRRRRRWVWVQEGGRPLTLWVAGGRCTLSGFSDTAHCARQEPPGRRR